jgi:glycosyltransferase involved in cell wall biosynthesis
MLQFAIAICTYNPDLRLLTRLLNALLPIIKSSEETVEVIIVDNNSLPPLTFYPEVQNFLDKVQNIQYIIEAKQGLTAARCAAIQATSAPIIVFFDDDNEPAPDYLKVLSEYFEKYPNVGIWGPGQIEVEYIDPVNSWFLENREKFQQRKRPFAYVCEPANWGQYYPNGTGFAVRREILNNYLEGVEKERLQVTGRKGKQLSSAEDVQIVWEGTKLGFAAGMIPNLKCNHLIPASKANFSYLARLHFGTASAYMPALFQSFPEKKEEDYVLPSKLQIYKRIIKLKIKQILRPTLKYQIDFEIANYIGGLYGLATAMKSKRTQEIANLAKSFQLL